MVKVNVNKVKIANTAFSNLTQVQIVDLSNAQFVNNSANGIFSNKSNLTSAYNLNSNITDMYSTFKDCSSLVNTPVIPNSVTNMYSTFQNCTSLVNAPVIPNNVTDMHRTFYLCSNLVNAPAIPNSVTDLISTFANCESLVNAPAIPNSVTYMNSAFFGCSSLVNAPDMSNANNVTIMKMTFAWCSSLVNAPVIPNSVTNMIWTFDFCTSLTGNIYINSNQIINAAACFADTTLTKNVYIPFTYDNGVNTVTYNSFISAGYDENGTSCGVYLKDINAKPQYTLTISPTPTDATVTLTAEGYTQSGNSITVEEGTTVSYKVEKDGYKTTEGSKVVEANETLSIELTIDSNPYNFGDRLGSGNGVATVVGYFTDSNAKKYAFAVLDAKYMGNISWSVESAAYTDTGLPNYTSAPTQNGTESATYNTDYILSNYTADDFPAFNHCRNASSIVIDGKTYYSQMPNAYELQQIYNNREALYALDPTASSYTAYNLANWSFGDNSSAWCSNENSEFGVWRLLRGTWYALNRRYEQGVLPIFEIEIS